MEVIHFLIPLTKTGGLLLFLKIIKEIVGVKGVKPIFCLCNQNHLVLGLQFRAKQGHKTK